MGRKKNKRETARKREPARKAITKKTPIVACAAALAALLAAGIAFALYSTRPIVVSFYGIDAGVKESLEKTLTERNGPGARPLAFSTLNPELALSEQRKEALRSSVIVLPDGAAARSLISEAAPPKESDLSLMASAIRKAGSAGSTRFALPILLDTVELAWNVRLLSQKGFGKPATLGELESSGRAVKRATTWPLICAGAEDADLSQFIGAIVEAAGGSKALDRLTEMIEAGKKIEDIAEDPLTGPGLGMITRWRREGLLHPEWLAVDGKTLEALMAGDAVAFVFMPLSRHRSIAQNTIEKYDGAFVPAAENRRDRAFIAPATVAVRIAGKREESDTDALFSSLVSAPVQKALAASTGLAPVNSSAETRDIQAANARLWAAASSGPRPDPLSAALPDPQARKAFAGELREWLRGQ